MKYLVSVVAIVIALLSTSCFEVREEITLKSNGSGTYSTVFDMSEMMGMLNMFMPDSLKGEMSDSLDFSKMMTPEEISKYSSIKGISNVRSDSDEEYVMKMSYDFANIDALNRSMAIDSGDGPLGISTVFKRKGSKFERVSEMVSEGGENPLSGLMGGEGDDDEGMGEMMNMMNKPTYTLVYNLPGKVKKVKTKGTVENVKERGKKVEIVYDMFEMMKSNGKVMDHCVKF